jgi:hypothetical protein
MAALDPSLLGTFQRHIEDMRNLSLCKICIKPIYEPFILACGHTYCYSCLANWFGVRGRKRIKNCPDCRAEVKLQPSPNYLLRDLVHMFIGRAELLPEDETVQEHEKAKEEEALLLAADRTGPGLFKGAFLTHGHTIFSWDRGILDPEDGVIRCPECHWELEHGQCLQCGFHEYEEPDDDDLHSLDGSEPYSIDTDFDHDGDELDHDFDGTIMHHPAYDPYETYESGTDASGSGHDDFYHDEDGTGRFVVDDDLDEVDDSDVYSDTNSDANSEATLTGYPRVQIHPSVRRVRRVVSEDETDDEAARPGTEGHHAGLNARSEIASRPQVDISDGDTNYDESTDGSGPERPWPTLTADRSRGRRLVLSDDTDEPEGQTEEERESEGLTTDESEDDEEDAGQDEPEELTETEMDEHLGSDDSDIRPPQPSTRRMQHLQSQRARRTNHSSQLHAQGHQGQTNHYPSHQPIRNMTRPHRAGERGDFPPQSSSRRRHGHHRPRFDLLTAYGGQAMAGWDDT